MNHVQLFEQYIGESIYNLGLKSEPYVAKLYDRIKGIKSVEAYYDMPRTIIHESSSMVYIDLKGKNPNIIEELKKALGGFDDNLDLNSMKTDFDVDDYHRSPHAIQHDQWRVTIQKKKDYHFFKNVNGPNFSSVMNDEVVSNLIDMLAQFSSEGHELANVKWSSLDDFLSSAADLMSKTNFTKYTKMVHKKYPRLS